MEQVKPNVARLMEELGEVGRRIEAEPRVSPRKSFLPPPPNPELEANWDVWNVAPVRSHRRVLGLPVFLAKRVLLSVLGPHNRELLRRQRDYNLAVKAEVHTLRARVQELSAAVAELQRTRR